MQKQIKTKKEIVQVTHEFYCDNCGKFLGSSEEWDVVIIKNIVLLKIIYVSIVVGIDIGKIYVTNVKMSLWLN